MEQRCRRELKSIIPQCKFKITDFPVSKILNHREVSIMNSTKSRTKKQVKKVNIIQIHEAVGKCDKIMREMKAITWRESEVGCSFTQDDKIALVDDKTLVIGGDIGSVKHDFRAFNCRGREFSKKPLEIENNEKGFTTLEQWILSIKESSQMEKVIVGMEPTGHYWLNIGSWLIKKGFTVVLVNPHHVKKSKELDDNLNKKTDRKDPKVIAGLVHEGRYSIPYIASGVYAELRSLSRIRLNNTEEQTRAMNRLKRWFSIHFPEYPTVYKQLDAKGSILLLKKAALPAEIIKLGSVEINQIWRAEKLRSVGLGKAVEIVSAAQRSIGSTEDPEAARMEMDWLIGLVEYYNAKEAEIEAKIEEISEQIPNIDKILKIKGVGLKTVAAIVAEIGDITRFNNAKQIQKLAGLALVEDSSGKHEGRTIISKRGRKRLRYQLYLAALQLAGHNDEFGMIHEYYKTRDQNPLKKMQSLMAVACKYIRVIYAILSKGKDYDPTKMITDVKYLQNAA